MPKHCSPATVDPQLEETDPGLPGCLLVCACSGSLPVLGEALLGSEVQSGPAGLRGSDGQLNRCPALEGDLGAWTASPSPNLLWVFAAGTDVVLRKKPLHSPPLGLEVFF